MARRLRLESEAGVYHVLNRGNYRSDVFRVTRTKEAFLKCLHETCERTGWLVHAWCLMSNHYHLAISTPRANLADGMRWMQGTFANRFNGYRHERGHLFQGRYKSLVVDPDEGLGPLCHYIHLNPVRARICTLRALTSYPWASVRWLVEPAARPAWYAPSSLLRHAGNLADSAKGRARYLEYLAWLAEDEPAQKIQRFAGMSTGWVIGTEQFTKELVREQKELAGQGPRFASELQLAREGIWRDELDSILLRLGRSLADAHKAGRYDDWKVAAAAALKVRTTVTNLWLSEHLHMGNRHHIGRRVAAWLRRPDPKFFARLEIDAQRTA